MIYASQYAKSLYRPFAIVKTNSGWFIRETKFRESTFYAESHLICLISPFLCVCVCVCLCVYAGIYFISLLVFACVHIFVFKCAIFYQTTTAHNYSFPGCCQMLCEYHLFKLKPGDFHHGALATGWWEDIPQKTEWKNF